MQTDSCLSLFSSAELHFSTLFSFLLLNTEHLFFFEKKNSTRFCLCLCQAPSPSSSFYSERKQNWSAPPLISTTRAGFLYFFPSKQSLLSSLLIPVCAKTPPPDSSNLVGFPIFTPPNQKKRPGFAPVCAKPPPSSSFYSEKKQN